MPNDYQLNAFIWYSDESNNCNTYLLNGPTPILIDPGHLAYFDHVQENLDQLGLTLADIGLVICTHAHPDHIEAVSLFKGTGTRIAMHAADWQLVQDLYSHEALAGVKLSDYEPDLFLSEGEFRVHGEHLHIYHTPGHSPGSICLYWPEQRILFPGDLIFLEGVGRSDLPGGRSDQLKQSVRRMAELEINLVLPGHGDVITGAPEVRRNFNAIQDFYFNFI
jgi:hydroxyacylglutathione hydrolase